MSAQVGAVLGLEGPQAVDLVLQQLPLLVQLGEDGLVLLLGVGDDLVALGVGVGDDLGGLLLAVAHVLVVDALGQGEHRGGGLGVRGAGRQDGGGLGNRGGGGLRGGLELAIAELGDAPLGGLELLLEVLVLHLERVDRGDDLVEELVDLDLVVALAELDVLELLVEDVLSGEQGHFIAFRSYGLVAPRFLLQRSWTTEWGPPAYTSRE